MQELDIPVVNVICSHEDNDAKMAAHIVEDCKAVIHAADRMVVSGATEPARPGLGIHEMGTTCMGKAPAKSVLKKFNGAHDLPNFFIPNGATIASGGRPNPTLTYLALSAHSANRVSDFLKAGTL